MNRLLLLCALTLAAVPLAGCTNSSGQAAAFDFVPGTDFKETGRTLHYKATVVDYDSEIYPGLHTFLWAFCFAPFDPSDTVTKATIEPFTPLPGDAPVLAPDGFTCSVPGPTLRVQQGDHIIVEFTHTHFHPHTIHWHGQYVPWQSDGAQGVTQDAVESGGHITYDFIAKRAGTLWYHCHVDAPTHIMQGLYGMMIVEPQDKKYEPKDIGHEEIMILGTMNRNAVEAVPGAGRHQHPPGCASGFPGCENPVSLAGQPDVYLINGHSYPYTEDQNQTLYHIKEGERVRFRILNAGETVEEIHLHGHDMQVVALDGNPVAPSARQWLDTITVGPGQRVDAVVVGNNPGPWMIHTHIDSHATNCNISPGGMMSMLVYAGYEDHMHDFKAELPAACPFGYQPSLPSDFADHQGLELGTATNPGNLPVPGLNQASATWTFPIDMTCAVRSVRLRATLDAPQPAISQNNLTILVKNVDGASFGDPISVGGSDVSAELEVEKERLKDIGLKAGNFTVEVSGNAVDAHLDLDVYVDYYESFEESKVAHLLYKVGGCPGYT